MTDKMFHTTYTPLTNYNRTKIMPPRRRSTRLNPKQTLPSPATPLVVTPLMDSATLEQIITQQVTDVLGNYETI